VPSGSTTVSELPGANIRESKLLQLLQSGAVPGQRLLSGGPVPRRRQSLQRIKWTANASATPIQYMCVDHRGIQILVAEQFLDRPNVLSRLKQMRGERVPQHMGCAPKLMNSSSTFWSTTTYDELNRPRQVVAPQNQNAPTGSTTLYSHNGLSTSITDPRGYSTTKVLTPIGELATVTDAAGSTLSYGYDAFGDLISTTDPARNTISVSYDALGRKTGISDPDLGSWSYGYDSLGELITQKDAKAQTITLNYDLLGRPLSRIAPDFSYSWTWDTAWVGALTQATKSRTTSGTPVYSRVNTYSGFGAVSSIAETIGGATYKTSLTYDALGRPSVLTYPNNFDVTIEYNTHGAEYWIGVPATGGCLCINNSVSKAGEASPDIQSPGTPAVNYWTARAWDNWGQVYLENLGNGVTNGIYRDAAVGAVQSIIAGLDSGSGVADFSYAWDADGNTAQRINLNLNNQTENFAYDAISRLGSDSVSNATAPTANVTLGYDALGDVKSKSDVGSYSYGNVGPHQVTLAGSTQYQYDSNGNQNKLLGSGGTTTRTYAWTAENQLSAINDTTLGQENFQYDTDGMLVSQSSVQSGVTTTTQYLAGGLAELVTSGGTSTWKNYLPVPTGPAAVVTQTGTQADTIEYLQKDNLGSIVAVTNSSGSVIQQYVYDTVGKRSTTFTASGYSGILTDLGYTSHVQIDFLNVVHMQGRVFDASTARFLSADPVIQSPGNLQSFNRYSYTNNNPLTYVDPSGFDTDYYEDDEGGGGDGGGGPDGSYGGGGVDFAAASSGTAPGGAAQQSGAFWGSVIGCVLNPVLCVVEGLGSGGGGDPGSNGGGPPDTTGGGPSNSASGGLLLLLQSTNSNSNNNSGGGAAAPSTNPAANSGPNSQGNGGGGGNPNFVTTINGPKGPNWTQIFSDALLNAGMMLAIAGSNPGAGDFVEEERALERIQQQEMLFPALPAFVPGGKTTGLLQTTKGNMLLTSGWDGPAASVPKGTSGFDIVTRTHVEGHAAAAMQQLEVDSAALFINNPSICRA